MWKKSIPPISSPRFPQTTNSPTGRVKYPLTPNGSTSAACA